jgi:hypothetical protein
MSGSLAGVYPEIDKGFMSRMIVARYSSVTRE